MPRRIGSVARALRQPVFEVLPGVVMPVGADVLTLPRSAALDSGVFAGAPYDIVDALGAFSRISPVEVRKNKIAICISEGTEPLVLNAAVDNEEGIEAGGRTGMKRARALEVEDHAYDTDGTSELMTRTNRLFNRY